MNSNNLIEFIIRCMQKDIEYSDHLLNKLLKVLDSFSHLFSLNISLNNIDDVSKILFNTFNYLLRKDKLSPGEEYTNISKKFIGGKFKLISYVIAASLQNYIFKRIHTKLLKYLETKNKESDKSQKNNTSTYSSYSSYYTFLLKKVFAKLYDEISNFDNIIEKIEEMQFCLLFINGKNYTFLQKIFGFGYTINNNSSSNQEEIISQSGFKFFGYLLLFKILMQIYFFLKKLFLVLRDEKQKILNKNNLTSFQSQQETESKKLNMKLKYLEKINTSEEKNKMCYICLEIRKDSSLTKCGHLFCWKCIINYLQSNPTCPFCRQVCKPQNVVHLKNYN
jgi:peroxin-10